jgi:hypothetical protein
MPYKTLAGMAPQRRAAVLAEARAFLDGLDAR